MIKISIIIPVYNVEQYLRDCLNTVLSQVDTDCEVICINDGSTDSSLKILEEYSLNYPSLIILNQENAGTASARNAGIKVAKGEYIWFIDSDDWILPNSITKLKNVLNVQKPEILCFNGKLKHEEDGREEMDEGIVENNLTGWEYYNKYALAKRKFHFVCVVLRLYKRDFLLENGLFFEKDISHEDNLWIPQVMYYAQSVICIPDLLYVYRIRKYSKMQTFSKEKIIDIIKAANRLADFFIPKQGIDKSVLYREIAGEYFSVFMPPKSDVYGNKYNLVKPLINWKNYKTISVYRRHKIIYHLIKIHPACFKCYLRIEKRIKNLL